MRLFGWVLAALSAITSIASVALAALGIWETGETASNLIDTGLLSFVVAVITGFVSAVILTVDDL